MSVTKENYIVMIKRIPSICVALLALALAAAAHSGQQQQLEAPGFIDPDEPFEALWKSEGAEEIRVEYATGGGDFQDAMVTDTGDGIRIRIPALGDTEADNLSLRVLAKDSGELRLERTLPIPEVQYHDITGDAAIVLTYPLVGVSGHAQFIPCCTIYNGLLRTMSLETNPANTEAGLPERVERPFVVLKPDHLAATTSGLGIVMRFGQAPSPDVEPAIYSYNDKVARWERISDPDVDAVERTLTAECANGGVFTLGWAPR
jgi:hypothetical protein